MMNDHTAERVVAAAKVAVTVDAELLREVDHWVERGEFPNRSRAFQAGLSRLLDERRRRTSFIAELAKLDPAEEKALAEEWLTAEADWPEF
jgi:Arc/MetJ-type ribon-helix-helix transcriptional regulator